MVKEELVEGLKMALSKGESLKAAMMTFYNAGYTKADIEEAARVMEMPQLAQMVQDNLSQGQVPGQVKEQTQTQQAQPQQQLSPQTAGQQPQPVQIQPTQQVQQQPQQEYVPQQTQQMPPPLQYQQLQPPPEINQQYSYFAYPALQPQSTQRVSAYGNTDIEPPNKTLVGSLLVILVLLFAALIGLFVFKNQIISFLNNIIG